MHMVKLPHTLFVFPSRVLNTDHSNFVKTKLQNIFVQTIRYFALPLCKATILFVVEGSLLLSYL